MFLCKWFTYNAKCCKIICAIITFMKNFTGGLDMYKYKKGILKTIILLFVAVVLYLTNLYDYLLFHSLAELFTIIIGFTLFVIVWNSRNFSKQHFDYLTFIGIAYMFV